MIYKPEILNCDCITGAQKHIPDAVVDLGIFDPPFGINEASFQKHYQRKNLIIKGYQEAPEDYAKFSLEWITEAKRILKPDGSMYIISGWSHLVHILEAIHQLRLKLLNHIIWKFNFGVPTKRKFATSHYHILYMVKSANSNPTFNTYSRFKKNPALKEKHIYKIDDHDLLKDLSDTWFINKEYHRGKTKNANKLPEALIKKMIQYSSNEGDLICDFFMGNGTTAIVAEKMNRKVCGFEKNKNSFVHFMQLLENI